MGLDHIHVLRITKFFRINILIIESFLIFSLNVFFVPFGYVWFPENAREKKLEGKMERKKKVRKVI